MIKGMMSNLRISWMTYQQRSMFEWFIVVGLLNVLYEEQKYPAIWDLQVCACATQMGLAWVVLWVSKQHLLNFLS
jgi:hypothetical protein